MYLTIYIYVVTNILQGIAYIYIYLTIFYIYHIYMYIIT